jgi:hypothetical protein
MVNNYYVYAADRDFGPFFLKFCSYFPFNAKLCLNGHEYAMRQLAQEEIALPDWSLERPIFHIRAISCLIRPNKGDKAKKALAGWSNKFIARQLAQVLQLGGGPYGPQVLAECGSVWLDRRRRRGCRSG